MSSSQPSSRPSPKWRSSLTQPKRQRPATSVSLIFAQPEQGSKLGSAIDKLPAAVGIDDAASFMSEVSRKRERTQSQASSFSVNPSQRGEEPIQRQAPQQPGQDVSRKRSKLSVDVPQDSVPAVNVSDEAAAQVDTQVAQATRGLARVSYTT
ncbi:hypothetical protein OH77DRAFT_969470 [Trametes cingulata]|nr:hypothetical protein OH77DRAFT_969470 [Trametes cingulata]